MVRWDRVRQLADRQRHLVAVWQLDALGVSSPTRRRLVARWGLSFAARKVVAMPGADDDLRTRLAAAVLSLSSPAGEVGPLGGSLVDRLHARALRDDDLVVCGHSAAHLYGMVPYTPERLDVHLTREQERADQPAVRIHRTRLVLPRHVVDGLPVASPEDALLGLAREWRHRRAGPFAVRLAIQRADSLRLVTEDGLAAFAQKAKGLHGVRVLRAALEQLRAGDLDHSGTEAELRRIVREIATELGLEVTRRPHLIRHRGIPLAEPDVAILELRYGAQADGPHHREIRRRWRDEDQDEALTDLEWTIQRFTDEDIWVHRDRVRARVRRALLRLLRDRARRRR